jgi:hypothetical protein
LLKAGRKAFEKWGKLPSPQQTFSKKLAETKIVARVNVKKIKAKK